MTPSSITWIFRANVTFFIFLLFALFGPTPDNGAAFFRILESIIFLVVIFVLPAINVTAIFSKISGKSFDMVEFLNIAAIFSILFIPLLISIEADMLNILSPHLPIMNAAVIFLLFTFLFRSNLEPNHEETTLFGENNRRPVQISLAITLISVAASIAGIVVAYYPLPDLDPYYWVALFQDQFMQGTISALSSSRPLFSSLTYLFNQSAGVDLYAFFKYLLPFFALFPFLSAILVARRFTRPVEQVCIFLLPLANASFFLYSTMPIPQAIFNSLLVTAILFSLHSILSGKKIFFHIAGAVLFIGFFYHEMAAIPLLAWLFPFLSFERKRIIRFADTNRIVAVLLLLLILSNFAILSPAFSFVSSWSSTITNLVTASRPNFAFPAEYVNIDGNSVGWQGATGVIRYYAFYFGPAALLALIFFPLALKHPGAKRLLKREESLFLLLSMGVFLLMSDIFPRLFSIALLPERALGFVSLFLLSLLPILFLALHERKDRLSHLVPALLLFAFLINLCAALYINDLKQYLITPKQLASAKWIQENLPEKRVIFSSGNNKLLRFYSNSVVVGIDDPTFYSDKETVERYLREYDPKDPDQSESIRKKLIAISDSLTDLSNKQSVDEEGSLPGLRKESGRLDEIISLIEERQKGAEKDSEPKHSYIYYAAPSEKNPYSNRPYIRSTDQDTGTFIFDRHPERFRMVYSDTENEIYIWEIL